VNVSCPSKLNTLIKSACFLRGSFTIFRNIPWYAASNPVDHIRDLKPSQNMGTTGIPSSFCRLSVALSISSPIMPAAQDDCTNIAVGLKRRFASRTVLFNFSMPPYTVSSSVRFVESTLTLCGSKPRALFPTSMFDLYRAGWEQPMGECSTTAAPLTAYVWHWAQPSEQSLHWPNERSSIDNDVVFDFSAKSFAVPLYEITDLSRLSRTSTADSSKFTITHPPICDNRFLCCP